MSGWSKNSRGPKRGQLKVSRKVKLLLALGAFGASMFFFWLAFNVIANCTAVAGHQCI